MRRLYADKLVIITAVLILLFSALFALLQSQQSAVNTPAPEPALTQR